MEWLILWAYIIVGLFVWVIAHGMFYRGEADTIDGPGDRIMVIILGGIIGFMAAVFWPFVLIIFIIHRIATHRVGPRE